MEQYGLLWRNQRLAHLQAALYRYTAPVDLSAHYLPTHHSLLLPA